MALFLLLLCWYWFPYKVRFCKYWHTQVSDTGLSWLSCCCCCVGIGFHSRSGFVSPGILRWAIQGSHGSLVVVLVLVSTQYFCRDALLSFEFCSRIYHCNIGQGIGAIFRTNIVFFSPVSVICRPQLNFASDDVSSVTTSQISTKVDRIVPLEVL